MTIDTTKPGGHRNIRRALQAILVIAALLFVWRFARTHQADIGRVPLRIAVLPLLLASLVWALAFGALVILWERSLRWWGARMRGAAALRVFFLANLARYVPGGVWQFAGLAAMSAAQGVPPIAATAAVLVQQAALLATGTALALALSPIALETYLARWGVALPSLAIRLTLAAAIVVALVGVIPPLLPPLRRQVERRIRDVRAVPHVGALQLAAYLAVTFCGWIGYGISFALFTQSVLGTTSLAPITAASIYVAAYVAGIVVIVLPGGIGVREGVLVAALTPIIGVDRAIFLAITSRLWLVALEVLGALACFAIPATVRVRR